MATATLTPEGLPVVDNDGPPCPMCGAEQDWEDCDYCAGDGLVEVEPDDGEDGALMERCPDCDGKGGWWGCWSCKGAVAERAMTGERADPPAATRERKETTMGLTTDRNDGCLYETGPATGQNKCYLILPDGERKELVHPIRTTYRHLKCGTTTTMARPIAETYAAQPGFYGRTFCVHCGTHLPVGAYGEFVWTNCDPEGEGTLVGTVNMRPEDALGRDVMTGDRP